MLLHHKVPGKNPSSILQVRRTRQVCRSVRVALWVDELDQLWSSCDTLKHPLDHRARTGTAVSTERRFDSLSTIPRLCTCRARVCRIIRSVHFSVKSTQPVLLTVIQQRELVLRLLVKYTKHTSSRAFSLIEETVSPTFSLNASHLLCGSASCAGAD